jgi:hypothetical protein
MTEYLITGYTPGDRRAVAYLQRLLWHGGPRHNTAYLEWKYRQNPYLDHRYIVLAWDGDELVGMIGAFGAYWEANSRDRMMLPCLADTVVATEHRGGPLFGRMLDELIDRLRADGVPWLLDFGDQPAGPAMLMQGWKAIGPWALAAARRERPIAERHSWTRRHRPRIRGSRSGIAILPTQTAHPSSLAAMAALVAQLPLGNGVRHVRDTQYLTWRYQNPLAHYFYLAAGLQELDGYLVAHCSRVDPDAQGRPTPTTIIDCEATSDEVWIDLLEVALSLLPGSVVLMWARDVSPGRLAGLGPVGFELDEPTGRLTRDVHLPNLLVHSMGILAESSPFAKLDMPSAWDLRAVCGRSWR